MKKLLVEFVLKEQIEKFFSGIETTFDDDSKKQRSPVACFPGGRKIGVLCNEGGRHIISRAQPFETGEIKIIRDTFFVATEYEKLDEPTQKYLITTTASRVIAKSLVDDDNSDNILSIAKFIETLEQWSSETYEGNRIAVSIGVDTNNDIAANPLLTDYTKEDFSKVMTNGYDTLVEFSIKNSFIGYKTLDTSNEKHSAPFRYTTFSNYTANKHKIAFVLNRNGEILVFKSGNLLFAKRRGGWRLFTYNSVLRQLAFGSRKLEKKLMESLYESILDVSFARTGACIGILQKVKERKFLEDKRISPKDRLDENTSTKTAVILKTLDDKNFQNTDRRLRQEILGIDGAVVLNSKGYFITAGAILHLEAGSEGGARLAAAKTLGEYGISIKVSADGEIKVFSQDRSFTFG